MGASASPPATVANADRPLDPIDNPEGSSVSLRVRSAVMPLGSVPYNGFSLPLISPDGRFVATQTGAPPDWAVTLAEPNARPPVDSSIEIYRIDTRNVAIAERQPPQRVALVSMPAVLGRSADSTGFLIESPRDDGSRSIGHVLWETGAVRWLVQDDSVNAFGALSRNGALAWSRRAADDQHFDLVIREPGGEEWTVPGAGGDWLMPIWSSVGDGLFAVHLEEHRMRICYGVSADARAFRASLRDFLITASADRTASFQTFSSQGATDGIAWGSTPQIMLFHPALSRMVIWQPLQPRDRAATQLNALSLAALQQTADAAIITTRDELVLQSLIQKRAAIMLVKGLWIPRRTPLAEWPYMLMSTGTDGRVGLTAMRMLPFETAPASADSGNP
jgi:hypothetical protein